MNLLVLNKVSIIASSADIGKSNLSIPLSTPVGSRSRNGKIHRRSPWLLSWRQIELAPANNFHWHLCLAEAQCAPFPLGDRPLLPFLATNATQGRPG